MSYKNLLQEYCMKNNVLLPIYYDESFGVAHQLRWQSTVVLQELKFCSDKLYPTKVAAQQSAAYQAYAFFNCALPDGSYVLSPTSIHHQDPHTLEIPEEQHTELKEICVVKSPIWIALIDVENLQPVLNHTKPIEYYVFMSEFSSIDKSKYYGPTSRVITVDSSNSDAADHLMSYYAGKLSALNSIKNYVILSRDKASATLATLLTTDGCIVKHFKDVTSFHAFVDSL